MVVVTTSTSRFPLSQDNGHDRLLQLIIEAVLEAPVIAGPVTELANKPKTASAPSTDARAPNFVFSTPVPQEILDFFYQFAQDIVSKDRRRIAQNYAQAYDHDRDTFATPSRLMFSANPPILEFVHITKIRIEKNRAYLRGSLKFAHPTYGGSVGVFPLENLIKLKGRWRWLGLPQKTALLDRDEYFDAELSQAQQQFVDECSGTLVKAFSLFEKNCFAEDFKLAGEGKELVVDRLQPFLAGRFGRALHVTGLERKGAAYRVQGYIEGSVLGDLRLPDDLHIIREAGTWKWHGSVN